MDNPSNINRSLKLSRSRALYAEAQKLLPGASIVPCGPFAPWEASRSLSITLMAHICTMWMEIATSIMYSRGGR